MIQEDLGLTPLHYMVSYNEDLPELNFTHREMYVTDDFHSEEFKLMLVVGKHDGKFVACEKGSWGGLTKSKIFTLYRFAIDKEEYEEFLTLK